MTEISDAALGGTAVGLPTFNTPSLRARALNWVLRLLPMKKRWSTAQIVRERVGRLSMNPPSHEPVKLGEGLDVQVSEASGWPVYRIEPAGLADPRNCAVFLHGGAYIEEIAAPHWSFVGQLARDASARCIVPIFPLAPHATAGGIVPALGRLLQVVIGECDSENVVLVGNSAGAGLAVAVAQWLRDNHGPQPCALVLISPWLDATVGRPEHRALAPLDPMQDIPGLVEAGRLYAGDLPVSHPFVSPLNGMFHSLAPMTVFSGTLDLLHPDSIALCEKAKAAGVQIDLHVKDAMPHNYPLLPTPEGREARELTAKIVGRREQMV